MTSFESWSHFRKNQIKSIHYRLQYIFTNKKYTNVYIFQVKISNNLKRKTEDLSSMKKDFYLF